MIPAGEALAVAAGAAAGSVARALVATALADLPTAGLALATPAVNIAGSFLIGVYAALAEPGGRLHGGPTGRLFFATGFCGGFTTFSILSLETLQLIERGAVLVAVAGLAGGLALCLAAVAAGSRLGARINRAPRRRRPGSE